MNSLDRAVCADPTRAPPGAWTGLVSAAAIKFVIPTPIAVEINDFQKLRKILHSGETEFLPS
jgi:hypothetical protein